MIQLEKVGATLKSSLIDSFIALLTFNKTGSLLS